MAYTTETRSLGASLARAIAEFRAALADRFAKAAIYHQTRRELEVLSDRDLADLGIARHQIGDIAREAAYRC